MCSRDTVSSINCSCFNAHVLEHIAESEYNDYTVTFGACSLHFGKHILLIGLERVAGQVYQENLIWSFIACGRGT